MSDNGNLAQLMNELRSRLPVRTIKPEIERSSKLGYKFDRGVLSGAILLNYKTCGVELVKRLKDNGNKLANEVDFWASLLSTLVYSRFDVSLFDAVSNPPSSQKPRHAGYHLASELAGLVAKKIHKPYRVLWVNDTPRMAISNINVKLNENKKYTYLGEKNEANILVVDDAVFTRQTALACHQSAVGDNLLFCFLYGN